MGLARGRADPGGLWLIRREPSASARRRRHVQIGGGQSLAARRDIRAIFGSVVQLVSTRTAVCLDEPLKQFLNEKILVRPESSLGGNKDSSEQDSRTRVRLPPLLCLAGGDYAESGATLRCVKRGHGGWLEPGRTGRCAVLRVRVRVPSPPSSDSFDPALAVGCQRGAPGDIAQR